MREWEEERVKARGDGVKFTLLFPDFEDYFETGRRLAGEGEEGKGVNCLGFVGSGLGPFFMDMSHVKPFGRG